MDQMEAIRAALDLPEDGDALEAIEALKSDKAELTEKVAGYADVDEYVSEQETTVDEVVAQLRRVDAEGDEFVKLTKEEHKSIKAALRTLSTERDEMKVRLDKVEEERTEERKDRALDDLVRCGRLAPANREFAGKMFDAGADTFDEYVNTLPPAKDLSRNSSGRVDDPDPSDDVMVEIKKLAKDHIESGMTEASAQLKVLRENPELHDRYIARLYG